MADLKERTVDSSVLPARNLARVLFLRPQYCTAGEIKIDHWFLTPSKPKTGRQSGRQTNRQKQAGRQAQPNREKQAGRHSGQAGWHSGTDGQARPDRQTGKRTEKNKQADRQTNRKNRQAGCLLYTSPSPRDCIVSRMPSSA